MKSRQPSKNSSRLVKWSVILGIIIILNVFFNYAISLVYEKPNYPTESQIVESIDNKNDCVSVGGQWTEYAPQPLSQEKNGFLDTISVPSGNCDQSYTKNLQYEAATKIYNRNIFIILLILGIASIIGGISLEQEVLSVAFSWGGVLSLLIASMRYWSDADNIVKVLLLAVALGGLIWVAVKKFGK